MVTMYDDMRLNSIISILVGINGSYEVYLKQKRSDPERFVKTNK
jgi:hypothetical protein